MNGEHDIQIAVAIERLEGRVDSVLKQLETYIASHREEHAKIAEAVVMAKSVLERELHTLNNLKHERDEERNLLATNDSVIALDKSVQQRFEQSGDAIDARISELKETAERRMGEIERQIGGTTGGLLANAKANAAWISGILLALAIIGFLLKYIFDK